MSVILLGDGNLTSSCPSFGSVTLPSPALNPDVMEDNVDVIEGDGGWTVMYEKGTYRRIFLYRFTLLTELKKKEIWIWWMHVLGQVNWFTLQPHGQPITSEIAQQEGGGSYNMIKNSQITQETKFWKGFWVYAIDGAAQGQIRKANDSYGDDHSPPNVIYVQPWFDNSIAYGNHVLLGYPVTLDEPRIEMNPRIPNFWDVTLVFKEKIMS